MDSATYRSSKNTNYKQISLRHMLVKTMAIIGAIRNNPSHAAWALNTDPLYIDLFAGPSCDPDTGDAGSPLIFMDVASRQSYRINAHFYDRDFSSMRQLAGNLSKVKQPENVTYVLHPTDNTAVSDILPQKSPGRRFRSPADQLGIAYADPSNADLNSTIAPLRSIANAYFKVDLIFNYAAASWKRQRALDHYRNVLEFLAEIPKQKWFIRKPIDRFQWTMLFGTNYLNFKTKELQYFKTKELQFWYDVRSEEGRRLLEQAAYTREELEASRQMSLFGER